MASTMRRKHALGRRKRRVVAESVGSDRPEMRLPEAPPIPMEAPGTRRQVLPDGFEPLSVRLARLKNAGSSSSEGNVVSLPERKVALEVEGGPGAPPQTSLVVLPGRALVKRQADLVPAGVRTLTSCEDLPVYRVSDRRFAQSWHKSKRASGARGFAKWIGVVACAIAALVAMMGAYTLTVKAPDTAFVPPVTQAAPLSVPAPVEPEIVPPAETGSAETETPEPVAREFTPADQLVPVRAVPRPRPTASIRPAQEGDEKTNEERLWPTEEVVMVIAPDPVDPPL